MFGRPVSAGNPERSDVTDPAEVPSDGAESGLAAGGAAKGMADAEAAERAE
ncbi:MAG: hypothetical protein L0H41_03050 [Microlunatus sp.]|nr:hypothetical protein [Microlunatus sp.]